MIAAIPVEWGAVTEGGTEHAWIFNTNSKHGRRVCLCEYHGSKERWTAPVPGEGTCWGCMHRAGGRGDVIDLTRVLKFIGYKHPYAVPVSRLYASFTLFKNRAVRMIVIGTLVDLGLVAKITHPGHGTRILALRTLRERLGMPAGWSV